MRRDPRPVTIARFGLLAGFVRKVLLLTQRARGRRPLNREAC
jgi:hypothetical protein